MDIKVTNIKVKVPGTILPVKVGCPSCGHISELLLKKNIMQSISQGTGEGSCHNCGAILTFDWER